MASVHVASDNNNFPKLCLTASFEIRANVPVIYLILQRLPNQQKGEKISGSETQVNTCSETQAIWKIFQPVALP